MTMCHGCGLTGALPGEKHCRGCAEALERAEHDEGDRDCACAGCVLAVERPIRPRIGGLSQFGHEVLGWAEGVEECISTK
jgi:hypothetical protein